MRIRTVPEALWDDLMPYERLQRYEERHRDLGPLRPDWNYYPLTAEQTMNMLGIQRSKHGRRNAEIP